MLVTYNILTERLIRRLSGGDIPDDSPYKKEFVKLDLVDAINEDLRITGFEKRHGDTDDKTGIPQVTATYIVDVLRNTQQQRTYAKLPDYFLTMKYQRGIKFVSEVKEATTAMVKCHHPTVSSHLPHQDMERSTYLYYIEGLSVYWLRDIKRDNIHHVLIGLLTGAPSNLGDDEPLPLLPDNVGRIMDNAAARVMNRFPQDRLADNNPNLRALNEQTR